MSEYQSSKVDTAAAAMAQLLRNRVLNRKNAPEILIAYENSFAIQEIVRKQCEALECHVIHDRTGVYLVPDLENTFLGYNPSSLVQAILGTGKTVEDLNIPLVIVFVLLHQLFDGGSGNVQIRESIWVNDLVRVVDDEIKQFASVATPEIEEEDNIPYKAISQEWCKCPWGDDTPSTGTKCGLVRKTLIFLKTQELITLTDNKKRVYPSDRLKALMAQEVLQQERFQLLLTRLSGGNEQREEVS